MKHTILPAALALAVLFLATSASLAAEEWAESSKPVDPKNIPSVTTSKC